MSRDLEYYEPVPSNRRSKKFMVRVWLPEKGRDLIVHFGDPNYEDFTTHGDPKRRENYLRRSAGIRDKYGNLTSKDYRSPNFWARRYLWDSGESYGKLPYPEESFE